MSFTKRAAAVVAVSVASMLTLSACDSDEDSALETVVNTGQSSIDNAQDSVQGIEQRQQQDFSEFEDHGMTVESR